VLHGCQISIRTDSLPFVKPLIFLPIQSEFTQSGLHFARSVTLTAFASFQKHRVKSPSRYAPSFVSSHDRILGFIWRTHCWLSELLPQIAKKKEVTCWSIRRVWRMHNPNQSLPSWSVRNMSDIMGRWMVGMEGQMSKRPDPPTATRFLVTLLKNLLLEGLWCSFRTFGENFHKACAVNCQKDCDHRFPALVTGSDYGLDVIWIDDPHFREYLITNYARLIQRDETLVLRPSMNMESFNHDPSAMHPFPFCRSPSTCGNYREWWYFIPRFKCKWLVTVWTEIPSERANCPAVVYGCNSNLSAKILAILIWQGWPGRSLSERSSCPVWISRTQ
jgi:hypothetical protein